MRGVGKYVHMFDFDLLKMYKKKPWNLKTEPVPLFHAQNYHVEPDHYCKSDTLTF